MATPNKEVRSFWTLLRSRLLAAGKPPMVEVWFRSRADLSCQVRIETDRPVVSSGALRPALALVDFNRVSAASPVGRFREYFVSSHRKLSTLPEVSLNVVGIALHGPLAAPSRTVQAYNVNVEYTLDREMLAQVLGPAWANAAEHAGPRLSAVDATEFARDAGLLVDVPTTVTPDDPDDDGLFPAWATQKPILLLAPAGPEEAFLLSIGEWRGETDDDPPVVVIALNSVGGTTYPVRMPARRDTLRALVQLAQELRPGVALEERRLGLAKFSAEPIETEPLATVDAMYPWIDRIGAFAVYVALTHPEGMRADALIEAAIERGIALPPGPDHTERGPTNYANFLAEVGRLRGSGPSVLLTFKPGHEDYGFDDDAWAEVVRKVIEDGSARETWGCYANVPPTTRAYIVRQGAGAVGIVGRGVLLQRPAAEDGRRQTVVELDWAVTSPPAGLSRTDLQESLPRQDQWRVQRTGLRLSAEASAAVDARIEVLRVRAVQAPPAAGVTVADETLRVVLPVLVPRVRTHLNVLLEGVPGTGKTFWVGQEVRRLREAGRTVRGERAFGITLHPSSGYEEFVEGLRPNTRGADSRRTAWPTQDGYRPAVASPTPPGRPFWEAVGATNAFLVQDGFFVDVCAEAVHFPHQDFVVLLDEINRCNIPKVLGDLLTTLETSKRARWDETGGWWEIKDCPIVVLPYSGRFFFVPDNVIVVATMNSTDRSVSAIDAALRRRFATERLWPLGFGDKASREGLGRGAADRLDTLEKTVLGLLLREEVADSAARACIQASVRAWVVLNVALLHELGPDAMMGHSYLFDMVAAVRSNAAVDRRWWIAEEDPRATVAEVWRRFLLPQLAEGLEAAHAVDLLQDNPTEPGGLLAALVAARDALADLGRLEWGVDGTNPILHRARVLLGQPRSVAMVAAAEVVDVHSPSGSGGTSPSAGAPSIDA